jgi:hypothetical protein
MSTLGAFGTQFFVFEQRQRLLMPTIGVCGIVSLIFAGMFEDSSEILLQYLQRLQFSNELVVVFDLLPPGTDRLDI